MTKAEVPAAIHMANSNLDHLRGLTDWVKQYDLLVEDFQSIIDRMDTTEDK